MTEGLSAAMDIFIEHFHWQRPLWLLALPLCLIAVTLLWRQQSRHSGWQQLIPEALLQHLLQGQRQAISRLPLLGLALIWTIGSVAMAGPSWEKIPQPIHKSERAMVVLLDLSPSMLAQDVKPSRLVRARLKLIDFLKAREEGLTALVAFAGEAHVITPLTDDTRTITSLVPSLSPNVMPLAGSNPEMAVELALQLFSDSGISQGELLMITDGIDPAGISTINDQIGNQITLSILGVGSDAGAPIPISSGGFAKDRNGGIVLAKLNSGELQQLSRAHGGIYRTLAATDADIKALAQPPKLLDQNTREVEREFDLWQDRGPWLALLLLPLLLLGFRRGWLLSVGLPLVLITLPNPQPVYAFDWQDLWQTADQQGQALLEQGQPSEAAKTFKNNDWAAASHYQAEEFEAAADSYARQDTASGHYNRGNALARAGKLEDAVEAYEQALEKNPELEDARFNQKLIEDLLQQQQNQQQNQQGDSQENSDQQNQDQQNQQGQQQNQQQGEQQQNQGQQSQSDQQSGNQSDSESQNQQSENSQQQNQPQQQAKPDQAEPQDSEQSPEQQSPEQQSQQQADQQNPAQMQASEELTPEQKEQQQALEQYLRKVPDDPSGLMRKKFEYQYHQRRKQYQQGTWQPPENNATERW
ncbi:MAG: hypothetical protein AseanaTS_20390 [Candidatus Pelagadaptatus aseana]|uniref:VWA domain-containing protein n=1 Tax=Candidatus Pelagadaptatus aseana TaxID=3120508 RepID=UPI0039B27237